MEATPAERRLDLPLPQGSGSAELWPIVGRASVRLSPAPPSRGPSVDAALVALGPFEGAARTHGGTPWLDVGSLVRLEAPLTGGRTTSLIVKVTARGPDGLFWFRMPVARSVERAVLVMLVWCRDFSLQRARALKIRVGGATALLETSVVNDDAMFARALEVRLVGNQAFGRLTGVRDAAALADDLDQHSINIVCRLGEKAVGTGRVVINDGDRSRSECEREAGLPAWLWEASFVEASRFAVCPEYRNGGIVVELFREVARIALQRRVRYIVLDCIEKLIPMYQRVGARSLGLSKRHPYSTERVTLMYVDLERSMTRLGGNLLFWLAVFAPVVDEARRGDALRYYEKRMTRVERLVWTVKKRLSIVASFVLRLAGR